MPQDNFMHQTSANALSQSKFSSLLKPLLFFALMQPVIAASAPTFTLQEVLSVALEQNPLVGISKAREEASAATLVTAGTYSNPQLELGAGPTRYRTPGNLGSNGNWGMSISQPIDYPDVRNAKKEFSRNQMEVASINTVLTKIDLRTRVKSAFYDVLQKKSILAFAEADRNLIRDIRDRVKLRVDTGESPKYELIKAEAESLAAERDFQTAVVKILETKAYLKGLVGASLPEDYELSGELPLNTNLPSVIALREKINETAQLKQVRAAIQSSEANLKLQQALVNPGLTVRVGFEQDPDLQQLRLGVQIPIPVWDQRRGPIAQADAELKEVNALLNDRELIIKRDIEASYNRYLIAGQQVTAYEEGLLKQADEVLRVAEAAYRFGERGILDYLDAQRTKRAVRKDYLVARYEFVNSMLEIERLLGYEFLEATP